MGDFLSTTARDHQNPPPPQPKKKNNKSGRFLGSRNPPPSEFVTRILGGGGLDGIHPIQYPLHKPLVPIPAVDFLGCNAIVWGLDEAPVVPLKDKLYLP